MSTLVETIKARLKEAMKAKDETARNILRLVKGEIDTAEARAGGPIEDEAGFKIIKKVIAANEATMEVLTNPEERTKLERENALLSELVPKALDLPAIVAALAEVREQIVGAKADGPAVGMAMKHLKAQGAAVEGQDVKTAVSQIRSEAS